MEKLTNRKQLLESRDFIVSPSRFYLQTTQRSSSNNKYGIGFTLYELNRDRWPADNYVV